MQWAEPYAQAAARASHVAPQWANEAPEPFGLRRLAVLLALASGYVPEVAPVVGAEVAPVVGAPVVGPVVAPWACGSV